MDLENYIKSYWDYFSSLLQYKITRHYEHEIFLDFPNNLPDKLKYEWTKTIEILLKEISDIRKLFNNGEISEEKTFESSISKSESVDQMLLLISLFKQKKNLHDINFDSHFISQGIIMNFALLDAFLTDSVLVICRTRPEIMKSKKTIEWIALIEAGSWDNIMTQLSEKYVYEFGWLTLKKRIEFFKIELGVNLELKNEEISFLDEAECVRNILVHNGGRISQEFINRTGRKELKISEKLDIPFEYLSKVITFSNDLAVSIVRSIATKFFTLSEKQMKELPERPDIDI